MAFPKFRGDKAPEWQGRQQKRYFIAGEVGYLVRHAAGSPPPDLNGFIREALSGAESLRNNETVELLIAALSAGNADSPRISTLPSTSTLFTSVKSGDEPLDDMALLNVIQSINNAFYNPDAPQDEKEPRLAAALPNWLSGAQQSIPGGTGGTGGLPVPATAPLPDLGLTLATSAALQTSLDASSRQHAEKVNVYVLDTAPGANTAESQRATFSATSASPLITSLFGSGAAYSDSAAATPYGRELSWNNQFTIHYDLSSDPDDPANLLMDNLVNQATNNPAQIMTLIQNGFYLPQADYDMSDHGLFISGLIAQHYAPLYANINAGLHQNIPGDPDTAAAPPVDIHLIQVLSDFGVGTMETFVRGVAKAIDLQQLPANSGSAAVINCSWVLSAPTQIEHMAYLIDSEAGLTQVEHYFLDEIARAQSTLLPPGTNFIDFVSFLQGIRTLHQEFAYLRSQQLALVVACAGNDRNGSSPRPSARHPAAYQEVIGVTSLEQIGGTVPSSYSNLADDPSPTGYAVWGGDNDLANGVVVLDETIVFTDANNSLVGLYFDANFPDALGNKEPTVDLINTYFVSQSLPVPPDLTGPNNPGIRANSSGLTHWTGTSFATPLMTALFAASLGWHWVTGNPTIFTDTEAAVTVTSGGATTTDLEIVIPLS